MGCWDPRSLCLGWSAYSLYVFVFSKPDLVFESSHCRPDTLSCTLKSPARPLLRNTYQLRDTYDCPVRHSSLLAVSHEHQTQFRKASNSPLLAVEPRECSQHSLSWASLDDRARIPSLYTTRFPLSPSSSATSLLRTYCYCAPLPPILHLEAHADHYWMQLTV